jgi:hypothetical protein
MPITVLPFAPCSWTPRQTWPNGSTFLIPGTRKHLRSRSATRASRWHCVWSVSCRPETSSAAMHCWRQHCPAACIATPISSMPTRCGSVRQVGSASRSSNRISLPTCCSPPTISGGPGLPRLHCLERPASRRAHCWNPANTILSCAAPRRRNTFITCRSCCVCGEPSRSTTPIWKPRRSRGPRQGAASMQTCWLARCPVPGVSDARSR